MQPKLFGTSGVRAVVNRELTPSLAVQIGLALATKNKGGKTVVAYDARTSSPMLENAVTAGLLAAGASVHKLGMQPTPVLAYLTKSLKAKAGVMITASHNPPQYNGIKIFNRDSTAYDEKQQTLIERLIRRKAFKRAEWDKLKKPVETDEAYRYVEMVEDAVRLKREWLVVLDPGNGATSLLAPRIFRRLGCRVYTVNAQPDGFFPGRKPEPDEDSLKDLCRVVRSVGADVGIAYDGDGDRMALVDERGSFTSFDSVLAAYAAFQTRRRGSAVIVTHVAASMRVEKMVEAAGGKVVRTRVGDVSIASALKKLGAVFGGEPCGAWIHPAFHYCPDGILSSALVLKALEEEGKRLSEFVAEAPEFPLLREKIPCPDSIKYAVVEKTAEMLLKAFPNPKEVLRIDGVRFTLENGWLLVRASGTEPLIRVTVEANSLKEAKQIMKKAARTVAELVKKEMKSG